MMKIRKKTPKNGHVRCVKPRAVVSKFRQKLKMAHNAANKKTRAKVITNEFGREMGPILPSLKDGRSYIIFK